MIDETYIIERAKKKAAQLGYTEFHIEPKEFTLSLGESREVGSDNEYYFISVAPFGSSVSSSLGVYNKEKPSVKDHITEHTGVVTIKNHTPTDMNFRFIRLLFIK